MILRWLSRVDAVVAAAALGLILWLFIQEMIARWFFNLSLTWTEDLARVLLVVMTYFGASALVRTGQHIRVDFLTNMMPLRARATAQFLSSLLCLGFSVVAVILGTRLAQESADFGLTFSHSNLALPYWMAQATVPAAFAFASVHFLRRAYADLRQLIQAGHVSE